MAKKKYATINTYSFTSDIAYNVWDHDRDLWMRFSKITSASAERLNNILRNPELYNVRITAKLHDGRWFDDRDTTTVSVRLYRI